MLERIRQPWGIMWPEINRFQGELERVFDRFNVNGPRQLARTVYPALNVWESGDTLYVEAELPGFELSDLEIYVTGENQLSIKGERAQPELEDGTWHRRERGFGSFSRAIELPLDVDPENVTASFKDGVLLVALAKKEELKPRKIEVKAS